MFIKSTLDFEQIYQQMFLDIKNHGNWSSEAVRTKYADGSPAKRKQIIGYSFKFDNSTDVVPLVRSRFIPTKDALRELQWIWIIQSNDVDELNKLGCKYWDEWAKFETNDREIIYIDPIKIEKPLGYKKIQVNELINPNGKLYSSNNSGDFYLIEKDKKTQKCKIQFKDTGYIKTVTNSSFVYGEVKDEYKRTVNGIGYLGDYMNKEILEYFGKYHKRWLNTWQNMISRCSGVYSGNKSLYEDVFVTEEFTSCEYFLRWVMNNNRYDKESLSILQLDKDYYGSRCYSEKTCTLLTPKENTALTLKKWYKYKDVYYFSCADLVIQFSNEFKNMNFYKPSGPYNDYKVKKLIKELDNLKLITIIENNITDGKLPRFNLKPKRTILKGYGYQITKPIFGHKNQLDYVLHELKNKPDSSRILTELWNVNDIDYMALTPCIHLTQWSVNNGRVDLEVRARSQDFALGLCSNVYQYSILHKLVSQIVGLPCGNMLYNIHNLHYYDRHEQGLEQQFNYYNGFIKHTEIDIFSKVKLTKLDNIYDFVADKHVELITTNKELPKYKFEIAI
jgi:thymidylate synthase